MNNDTFSWFIAKWWDKTIVRIRDEMQSDSPNCLVEPEDKVLVTMLVSSPHLPMVAAEHVPGEPHADRPGHSLPAQW